MGLFSRKIDSIPPTPMGAIAASGATYRVSSYADATHLALQRQLWQDKAYRMYDVEGHLYYATNYIGSAMSRLKLCAAIRTKDGATNSEPTPIETGPFADAVRAISSPRGGQNGLLRQVARNIFLAGEVWMIGAADVQADGSVHQVWDAVSIHELVTNSSSQKFMRKRLPGVSGEYLPDGALTIRIWKEHPEFSELADSGVRSAMELLEKLVTINRAEKAIARSRLAGAGILAIPQELVPPAWQNQDKNANPMESNPLWQAVAESMTAPLSDEGHPSSVVPLVLVGPGDQINKINYVKMDRAVLDSTETVNLAVDQLANTLELPKEVLLGVGDATHWTAWFIKEETWEAHLKPLADLTVGALTQTYLSQAIRKMSPSQLKAALDQIGVEDPNDIIVWYDKSDVVTIPDKADKAGALHDRFVLSDEALRRESGYSEADAPSALERAKRIGVKMLDPHMALTGEEPPADVLGARQTVGKFLSGDHARPATTPGIDGPITPDPGTNAPGRPIGTAKSANGPRGTTPQGPRAAAPKTAAERRAGVGKPQDSNLA